MKKCWYKKIPNSLMYMKTTLTTQKKDATSGNRTRAARVAGEHSTTEPTLLIYLSLKKLNQVFHCTNIHWCKSNVSHDIQMYTAMIFVSAMGLF